MNDVLVALVVIVAYEAARAIGRYDTGYRKRTLTWHEDGHQISMTGYVRKPRP